MPPSIAVELISVQTPIHALPGDQLMIYNGTCIGVYQPEGVRHRPQHPNIKYNYTPEQIIAIIRTHGPSTGEQICNYLNVPMKDKSARASIQRKVRHVMLKNNELVRHPEDKRARFPRYMLATKPASKAA